MEDKDKIIEELKAENEIILNRLTQYEEDADVQVCLFSDTKRLEQENKRLKSCLQEIKTIAEYEIKELTDSAINGGRYLKILNLITKAESEG